MKSSTVCASKVKSFFYCLIVLLQIRDECLANVRRQLEEKEAELESKLKKLLAEIGEHTHETTSKWWGRGESTMGRTTYKCCRNCPFDLSHLEYNWNNFAFDLGAKSTLVRMKQSIYFVDVK